jgi:hypothetical protein
MPERPRKVYIILSPLTAADGVAIDAVVRARRYTTVGVGVHYLTTETHQL